MQFAAYKQFCDDTTVEKQRAIKEANAKMEQLSAAIQKVEAHFCNRASGPGMWYLVPSGDVRKIRVPDSRSTEDVEEHGLRLRRMLRRSRRRSPDLTRTSLSGRATRRRPRRSVALLQMERRNPPIAMSA